MENLVRAGQQRQAHHDDSLTRCREQQRELRRRVRLLSSPKLTGSVRGDINIGGRHRGGGRWFPYGLGDVAAATR
jgi:hypothetical protein